MLHVVGAGLAGLAAAVAASRAGMSVTVHEATDHAGGRCRSFYDPNLREVIDNGTHLVMDVNQTALRFAQTVGGLPQMDKGPARYPFINLATGQHWTLTSWSLLKRPHDLLRALGAFGLDTETTVRDSLGRTKGFETLWEPLCVAALNTETEQSSARLFAQLLKLALKQGMSALNPWVFPQGLSAAFVDPAVEQLQKQGVEINYNRRLRSLQTDALMFDHQRVVLGPQDQVILAVPPWAAREFLPSLPPLATRAIVNGHFKLDHPITLPGGLPWLGLTGGLGQWVSVRDTVVSVTISAADLVMHEDADTLALRIWTELAPYLALPPSPIPPHRIIKEKRATIAHTPQQVILRPGQVTPFAHITLAGDWVKSQWPCTIEAALLSGLNAVRQISNQPKLSF